MKKLNIIRDEKGRSIVIVNDIRFQGKQNMDGIDTRHALLCLFTLIQEN